MCGRNFLLWICCGYHCQNQQSYGQIYVTVGLRRSERSRNNFERHSNYSLQWKDVLQQTELDRAAGPTKSQCQLLSFYTYAANCLLPYLLSSMASYCHNFPGSCVRKCANRSVCGSSKFKLRSGITVLYRITMPCRITIPYYITMLYSMMYHWDGKHSRSIVDLLTQWQCRRTQLHALLRILQLHAQGSNSIHSNPPYSTYDMYSTFTQSTSTQPTPINRTP